MGFSINIDIGGTFTDFYITQNGKQSHITKTLTTHYDLSVCFLKGIQELARFYGMPLNGLLSQTDEVRYCTTLGTNTLIERTGPKLGLITTAGFEDTIFLGRGRSWADGLVTQENKDLARIKKPLPLIPRHMVVGVRERTDSFGRIICPLKREEVLEKLQILVDQGAMGFVVCFLWSFVNPTHERMIKEIIEEEYPEDYLGAMSVTLSSEVSAKCGEYTFYAAWKKKSVRNKKNSIDDSHETTEAGNTVDFCETVTTTAIFGMPSKQEKQVGPRNSTTTHSIYTFRYNPTSTQG